MFFSLDTLNVDEARYAEGIKNTWAEGRVDTDMIDINGTVKSLMAKGDGADYSEETAQIGKCLAEQIDFLNSVIAKEKTDLAAIVSTMKTITDFILIKQQQKAA